MGGAASAAPPVLSGQALLDAAPDGSEYVQRMRKWVSAGSKMTFAMEDQLKALINEEKRK